MTTNTSPLGESKQPGNTRKLAHPSSPGPSFSLHPKSCSEREKVERYIARQFRGTHGATIRDFMPLLVTMSCDNLLSAAVGIRPAQGQALFLEQYLGGPVEKTISHIAGRPVERRNISEIGNLVATKRGSSQLLFLILTAVVHSTGSQWLVFTATPAVQKSIRRLGFKFFTLCDADPAMLHETTCLQDWGSYYQNRPQVVAGRLSEAMAILACRKFYSCLIARHQGCIDALVEAINIYQGSSRPHSLRCDPYTQLLAAAGNR